MTYDIPGREPLTIKTIILDLNGTLTVGGVVPEGVKPRLGNLKAAGFKIILFTGNARGNAEKVAKELGIEWKLIKNSQDKRSLVLGLETDTCAAIGNGLIDLELMKAVTLRIVTLQAEGAYVQTLINSDIVVPTINDALDLFIDPQRLIATLKK